MKKCPNPRCDSWGNCANPEHKKNRDPPKEEEMKELCDKGLASFLDMPYN